jgi:hypothetical protein
VLIVVTFALMVFMAATTVGAVVEGGGVTLVTFWFRLRYAVGTRERVCGVAGIAAVMTLYAVSGATRCAAFALAALAVYAARVTTKLGQTLDPDKNTRKALR